MIMAILTTPTRNKGLNQALLRDNGYLQAL